MPGRVVAEENSTALPLWSPESIELARQKKSSKNYLTNANLRKIGASQASECYAHMHRKHFVRKKLMRDIRTFSVKWRQI